MVLSRWSLASLALIALCLLTAPAQVEAQQKSSAAIFDQSVTGIGYSLVNQETKPGNLEVSHYSLVEGNQESKISAVAKNRMLVEVYFDTPKTSIAQPFQQAVGMAFAALLYTGQPAIFRNKKNFEDTVTDFAEKMATAWEKGGNQTLTHTGVQVKAQITGNRILQKMSINQ